MKLLASAIATAALILSGLVAVPTASAAPYPGTVRTTCSITISAGRAGERVVAIVRVRAAGNAKPRGGVTVNVFNNDGVMVRTRTEGYRGPGAERIGLGSFSKGRYTATMSFDGGADSVFTDCSDSDGFRVKPRRGRR